MKVIDILMFNNYFLRKYQQPIPKTGKIHTIILYKNLSNGRNRVQIKLIQCLNMKFLSK